MHFLCPALCLLLFPTSLQKQQPAEPLRLGQPVKSIDVPSWHRSSIAFSPDGKSLAWVHHQPDVLPNDGGGMLVHLWDIEKRIPLVEMKPANRFTYACSPICFTPNGRMLMAGCFQLTTEHELLAKPGTLVQSSVRVWLVASGRELPITPHEQSVKDELWQAVSVAADGKSFTAVDSKGGRVWKMPEGEVTRKFEFEPATNLILAPDGKFAAGVVKDQSIRVWSTDDGKEIAKLPGPAHVLGFSPDSKKIATLHGDKFTLSEIPSAKELLSLPIKLGQDNRPPAGFAFSPDGKLLAWTSDGSISIADTSTGQTTVTLKSPPGPLAFSPDSRSLAVACPDGTALIWSLSPPR